MSIEDVEELLGCNIGPEEDYDTLSGLITDKLDRIPAKDEHPVVRINNVEFTVLDTEERRIAKLRADILPEEPKPEESRRGISGLAHLPWSQQKTAEIISAVFF